MRRITVLLSAVVLLLTALPARAADDDAAREAEKRAKSAIARFRQAYRSRNVGARCNALLELSSTAHPLVVAEMAAVLRKDPDENVRVACAMVLGDMTEVADAAGAALKENVARNEDGTKVLVGIADSIGKLGYAGAHEELLGMLDHKDQDVAIAAIRAIGDVKDLKALPKLYDMAEYEGTGYSWSTGEVTVDTGASGDTDQKAAEAAWKAKYGGVRPRKAGPTVVKMYMRQLREAVEKLTGEKFKDLPAWKAWMDEHAEECGLEPAKPGARER